MVYYVEYLRAMRALRIVAILIGLILVAALVIRFSWGPPKPATTDYYSRLEHSKTAHVTRKRLPNGDTRTIVNDPRAEVYAIIDRHGSSVVAFTLAHTREAAEDQLARAAAVKSKDAAASTHQVRGPAYETSEFDALFGMTLPMGLLVATLLGGPLSKENDGHLEVVWTKPVSRTRYGFTAMLVDLLTLAVAQAATALALIVALTFWGVPRFGLGPSAGLVIASTLVSPIAWYAFLTGLSASVKRGPGIVLGIGWVVAIIVPWIASSTSNASAPVGRSVHAIFDVVSDVIPFSYVWGRFDLTDSARTMTAGLTAMAALTVVYLALALVQWRRLEA